MNAAAKESPTRGGYVNRRRALAGAGALTASWLAGGAASAQPASRSLATDPITAKISQTPFVDTHEHLVEEARRTQWTTSGRLPCNDWALLFGHYLDSDLKVAGMPGEDFQRFLSPDLAPDQKWPLLAPYWPAVKHTGYGQAVRIALEQLYGVTELTAKSVARVVEGYRQWVKPGFYETILRQHAGVESCQVNSLETVFMESQQPLLLMQDISMLTLGSVGGAPWTKFTDRAGRKATDLASWHGIIDSHFDRYGPYAVAVKTQVAYQRRLDFSDVPAEQAAGPFAKLLAKDPVGADERKLVEDHLFWYCVRKATAHSLPVKLHTGYYAGHGSMPLGRVMYDPADVSDLLRRAPETTFVLMHIGYPYQEPMIALAKHYHNAVLDLCWAWIINPAAATRFVEDFLMAAPANKLLTFGGDYVPVEPVVGHARLARRGLAQALERLAASGWVSRAEALELIEPLMRGNARRLFRLEEKERVLRRVPWLNQA